jgi:hypothetical protein
MPGPRPVGFGGSGAGFGGKTGKHPPLTAFTSSIVKLRISLTPLYLRLAVRRRALSFVVRRMG